MITAFIIVGSVVAFMATLVAISSCIVSGRSDALADQRREDDQDYSEPQVVRAARLQN